MEKGFQVSILDLEALKSRIRETKNLLTDADSSTSTKKLLSIFFHRPCRRRRRRRQGAFGQRKKTHSPPPFSKHRPSGVDPVGSVPCTF